MRILIVDDEDAIRKLVRKYAEFAGYEVAEAKDGMEAVLLCRKEEYDCVIMDIMMPELDGFSACREIRKTSSVPILLLSARGEEYDKINGFEFGADDYIVKPFSPRELMLRVEAVLRRVKTQGRVEKAAESAGDVYTYNGLSTSMYSRPIQEMNELPLPMPEIYPHWEEFYENVMDAIEGKAEQIVTHGQILNDMKVLMAAFESARTQTVVKISL